MAEQDDQSAATALEAIEETVLDVAPDSYFGDESATLGDRIAAARQAARLTQSGLGARLGVSAKIVSSWENDRSEPRANRLTMLAGLLNVSVSWLLTGGGEGVAPPETDLAAAAPKALELTMPLGETPDDAARFYGDLMGCLATVAEEGGLDIAFYGHTLRLRSGGGAGGVELSVEVEIDAWRTLSDRLRTESADFVEEPAILDVGGPRERGALTVRDPGGTVISVWAIHRSTT